MAGCNLCCCSLSGSQRQALVCRDRVPHVAGQKCSVDIPQQDVAMLQQYTVVHVVTATGPAHTGLETGPIRHSYCSQRPCCGLLLHAEPRCITCIISKLHQEMENDTRMSKHRPVRPEAVRQAITALMRSGLSGCVDHLPSTCSVMRSSYASITLWAGGATGCELS